MSPADSPFAQLPAPGPHPATAELRAYAAGTLAPADEHRIEAHTLDCERCAELVEGFSMSDGATTDRAVAELRTRLQARLGQAEPEPVAGWAWSRIAAAAALLGVVGTGIWGWEKYEKAPSVARHEAASAPAANQVATAAKGPLPDASAPATASSAPATAAPADYAAVPPAAPRQSKPRIAQRSANQNLGGSGWLANSAPRQPAPALRRPAASPVMSEVETSPPLATSETTAGTSGAGQDTQAPTVSNDDSRESKLANADVAPAAKSEGTPAARPATDTALSLSEVVVAAPATKKMKALMPSAAPAMVPNTPMPAGFAIKPAPVGGTPAFRDYLRREASQFEPEINNLRLSGTVRVQFTVGADGQLSNLKVTRGLRADYDEEALRLVCEGPKWQPGIAGGRRAPLVMEFTVPF